MEIYSNGKNVVLSNDYYRSWEIRSKDIKNNKMNGLKLLIFGYLICNHLTNCDSKIYRSVLEIISK